MEFAWRGISRLAFDVCRLYAFFAPTGTISGTFRFELNESLEGVYDVSGTDGICDS